MILAAIPWLDISINVLLFVFVIVCLLMTLLILMQRPKQEGLGAAFGAGVTDQVFGARTTNVLQRGTVYLATMFFVISLALAILIGLRNKPETLVGATPAETVAPAEEAVVEAPVVEETQPASLEAQLPPAEIPGPAETPAEAPADASVPAPEAPPADAAPLTGHAPAIEESAPEAPPVEDPEQP